MKKLIIFSILILFAVSGAFAQSLQNNQFYKKSVEYRDLSQKAFDEGNYDQSIEYAKESQRYAELSRQYITEQVLAYRARTALNAAKSRMNQADRANLKTTDPDRYAQASTYYQNATNNFDNKNYQNSIEDAQKVLDLLAGTFPGQASGSQKVAFYEVKLIPNRRDCLWRIAEYDFVYGDPWKWKVIYEANRDNMPDPNNPGLIHPGQVLKIPSVAGEERSGRR